MNRRLQRAKIYTFDLTARRFSTFCLYVYRKVYIEPEKFGYNIPIEVTNSFLLVSFNTFILGNSSSA
jgi:hypothetical protein